MLQQYPAVIVLVNCRVIQAQKCWVVELSEGVWAVSASGRTDFFCGREKDKHQPDKGCEKCRKMLDPLGSPTYH